MTYYENGKTRLLILERQISATGESQGPRNPVMVVLICLSFLGGCYEIR